MPLHILRNLHFITYIHMHKHIHNFLEESEVSFVAPKLHDFDPIFRNGPLFTFSHLETNLISTSVIKMITCTVYYNQNYVNKSSIFP